MRVFVIDDEKSIHIILNRLLSQIDAVEVVGCFQHAEEAIEQIKGEAIDLVFVDIMIGQDNGLEVARQLRTIHPELEIVFLTSHKEFAVDSFESYPLDYMIKPVSKARLEHTIARAATRIKQKTLPLNDVNSKLTVRVLGGFEVLNEQGISAKWISKKSMELFAFLLIHRGKSVSKSRIIEQMFSHMPQKNAAIYLNTTVYQLRKSLQSVGHRNLVIHSQEQYSLRLDAFEVDFILFEEETSQFTAIQFDQLERALACEHRYTGDLFEDRDYDWSHHEQVRLYELYNRFTKQLVRDLLTYEKYDQAIRLLRRLLMYNEWDEETNLLLFQIYGDMDDKVSFARHYEHLSNLYQQELSIPVSEKFTKLYERFCIDEK